MLDRGGRPLACLLFGSAAWQCAPRDRLIGWTPGQQAARLQGLTNQTRFLILPWVRVAGLASHVLGLVVGRLRQDWQTQYARPLELVETFVDPSRFTGTCYGAANWLEWGATTGRPRNDQTHRPQVAPKAVWVYPLHPLFRTRLCG